MPRSQYSTLQCGIQAISKKFSIRRGIFKIGVCRNFFQKTNIFFVPKNEKSARNLLFLRFGCVWGFRGFFISAQSKNRPEKAVLFDGGDDQTRTDYLYVANVSLYRVSYIPVQFSYLLYKVFKNFSIVFALFFKIFLIFSVRGTECFGLYEKAEIQNTIFIYIFIKCVSVKTENLLTNNIESCYN